MEYEIRPRKDKRGGVDLIFDVLPYGVRKILPV